MKQTIIFKDNGMYAHKLVLDDSKYRGKGRPRKSDYTPMIEYMMNRQKILNTLFNESIEKALQPTKAEKD